MKSADYDLIFIGQIACPVPMAVGTGEYPRIIMLLCVALSTGVFHGVICSKSL